MTSAFTGDGIQSLFNSIGLKLIDPNFKDKDDEQKNDIKNKKTSENVKLNRNDFKNENKKKKKNFC